MSAACSRSDVTSLVQMAACSSFLETVRRAARLALQAQRQRDLYQNLLTKLNKRLGDTLEAMSAERRSLMDTAEVLRRQFEAVADAAYDGADDELGRSGAVFIIVYSLLEGAMLTPVSNWPAGLCCMLPDVQWQISLWKGSTGLHRQQLPWAPSIVLLLHLTRVEL